MHAVRLNHLKKTFKLKRKSAGLKGSVKSLFRPDYQTVDAVQGISLEIEMGELLAFIGPNGAGKSTTIKMLTGILHPTSGEVQVLDYVPHKQRRELAYHIGSIFGQKPQLWYHLPPIDTFELFAHIYELDYQKFLQRKDFLIEALDIGDFLETPVRKLSLGQRMLRLSGLIRLVCLLAGSISFTGFSYIFLVFVTHCIGCSLPRCCWIHRSHMLSV